ncbi:MAG: hypothetical protein N3A01_08055 [Bacteroidales bacterium]|nr:hypothetical protein [Bacteroidales bacterium]
MNKKFVFNIKNAMSVSIKIFSVSLFLIICINYNFGQRKDTTYIIKSVKGRNIRVHSVKPILSKEEFEKRKPDTAKLMTLEPYVNIENTNIMIAPPKYFIYNSKISGFIHLPTTAAINIKEIKGYNYELVTANLTDEYIASQNAKLISVENITTSSGMPGKLYTLRFNIQSADSLKKDIPFERLMLFTGDINNTIWVNATYPLNVKIFVEKIIKKSILSVKFKE